VLTIATWNVNSIRARHDRVLAWVRAKQPDVLCLQELKADEKQFPGAAFQELGYQVALFGQKAYNGVAIASRTALTDVTRGFGDGGDDEQARFIAGTTAGVRVMCLYVPNGMAVGSDKFVYKLDWLGRLRAYLAHACRGDTVVCGDFNVAPTDRDVYDPVAFASSVLCTPVERGALEKIREVGLVDVARKLDPEGRIFTWWDYAPWAFVKDKGLRIDLVLASEGLAARARRVTVDRDARKDDKALKEKPSDHAPVLAEFA
jgi:exodeoxyribonuclease-3